MPYLIAEQLRQAALKCSRLAKDCTDKNITDELEGISALLAEKAKTLDDLFRLIDEIT